MDHCGKPDVTLGKVSDESYTCTCHNGRKPEQAPGPRPCRAFEPVDHISSDSDENSDHALYDSDTPLPLETRLRVANHNIERLRREKSNIRQQLKEVTKMNTRWQKYDKERDAVVDDLTAQLQQSREKIDELEARLSEQRDQTEELELRWTDARVRAAERQAELERCQQKIQALELNLRQSEKKRHEASHRLDAAMRDRTKREDGGRPTKEATKDRDLYQMSKRVVDLKEKASQLQDQLVATKTQMTEQADLYTQQISICLEDFKQEKKEKDRIKKENDDLKKQLKKSEDFANSLKVQITRYQEQQRNKSSSRVLSTRHVQNYYADMFMEPLDDSWDDAGYTLPRDVVHDAPNGFDETDLPVTTPMGTCGGAIRDPPPQYDDRSIMGQVVFPRVKRVGERSSTTPLPTSNLVLH
ncbi:uncharacterized protein [Diadema setosum]|uniref:uncharacterized protein n=1 Tax=Diadema setosum TaxID=31175 RepID=UPI003B3A866F